MTDTNDNKEVSTESESVEPATESESVEPVKDDTDGPPTYCFKCRKRTGNHQSEIKLNVKGRVYRKSKCIDCDCTKCIMLAASNEMLKSLNANKEISDKFKLNVKLPTPEEEDSRPLKRQKTEF